MKKHRIIDIHIWKNETSAGFSIATKNGIVAIPFTGNSKGVQSILKRHLPHFAKRITEQNGWDWEELKELLVGKYCYGTAQVYVTTDGFVERRLG